MSLGEDRTREKDAQKWKQPYHSPWRAVCEGPHLGSGAKGKGRVGKCVVIFTSSLVDSGKII